jgi:hypothetical protein
MKNAAIQHACLPSHCLWSLGDHNLAIRLLLHYDTLIAQREGGFLDLSIEDEIRLESGALLSSCRRQSMVNIQLRFRRSAEVHMPADVSGHSGLCGKGAH